MNESANFWWIATILLFVVLCIVAVGMVTAGTKAYRWSRSNASTEVVLTPRDEEELATKEPTYSFWIIGTVAFVLVIYVISGPVVGYISENIYQRSMNDDSTQAQNEKLVAMAGQLGDRYGAVNALFSSLALCGVILTLYHQMRDSNSQQYYNEQTRSMDEQTRMMNEKTLAMVAKQNFENTFFALTNQLRSRYEELNRPPQEGFGKIRESLDKLTMVVGQKSGQKNRENRVPFFEAVEAAFRFDQTGIESYMRLFDTVVQFVAGTEFIKNDPVNNEREQKFYMEILRSQLSQQELVALFYFGLTPQGKSMKLNIEKYGLLKYLHLKNLIDGTNANFEKHGERTYKYNAYERENMQHDLFTADGLKDLVDPYTL